jgi:type 1 glutamine amidotransferase
VKTSFQLCLSGLSLWILLGLRLHAAAADEPWVVYEGKQGAGQGKHVVLVSGDEEYRSEETLTQLGRILAKHHGFRCTVLYAIDTDGTINPVRPDDIPDNIPGLEQLATADLMVIFTRFRNLPDDQMQHIVDYVESGKPIVGLRTATHAFQLPDTSRFARYSWANRDWDGGFGRQVLGETWVNHHGHHGVESTRGVLVDTRRDHPILRGLADGDIYGPTDVYTVTLPLPGDCQPLVLGQVLEGMDPSDKPVAGAKNDPMMPIAWIKTYTGQAGRPARVFTTTMGAAQDLRSAGLRRLLVNACYWAVGLEAQIPAKSNVDIVGTFEPLPFGFGKHQPGVRPADLR